MKNCPTEFYANCSNANVKCFSCCAGRGTPKSKLHYEPISNCESLAVHPYSVDKAKQQRLKQAKAVERKVINSLAKGTLRSGAAAGDGDALVLSQLGCEIKDRGERSSFNLTLTEYNKGIKQGVDIFAISIIRPDTKQSERVYLLTEGLMTQLLAIAKTTLTEQ
jgi:hypothetical protein